MSDLGRSFALMSVLVIGLIGASLLIIIRSASENSTVDTSDDYIKDAE